MVHIINDGFEIEPARNTDTDLSHKNIAISYLANYSEGSRVSMRSVLNIVARLFGYENYIECDWSKMRRHHVLAVTEHLHKEGKSPATINTHLAVLKGISKEAWAENLMSLDEYQRINTIKRARGERLGTGRQLTKKEIKELFKACKAKTEDYGENAKAARDSAILAVLLGCGLRRSEAADLTLADYDEDEKTLRILGKGNKERLSYLPNDTNIFIKRWLHYRGNDKGALFLRMWRGGRISENGISSQAILHILETLQKKANIKPFKPHDARRTFASMMLANDEDILTVRDSMGHSSVATTELYDMRDAERLREASQRLVINQGGDTSDSDKKSLKETKTKNRSDR